MTNMLRTLVTGYVENIKDKLEDIVDTLYENPEESFEERNSSRLLIDILSSEDFNIEKDTLGIKHSFIAKYGDEKPTIGLICEYNSAGIMGHGFGHNIQSAVGIGAAVGLKRAIELNEAKGSVVVLGCPAEEGSSTKISMLNQELFNNIDAVLSIHPYERTCESGSSLGMKIVNLKFIGREAHTSINYKEAVNALDPVVMMFSLINKLKVNYGESIFINGVITRCESSVTLIPGETECSFMVKGVNTKELNRAVDELLEIANFAAKVNRCTLSYYYPEPEYLPLKTHSGLSRVLCHNLKEKGIIDVYGPVIIPASLDLGNISYKIPTVQPYIGICDDNSSYYTMEFSKCTITEFAKDRMLKASCALALTGVDIIQNPAIIKAE